MLKRIARIRNDGLRIALLLAMFVPQMAHFAVCLAWHAPHRFWMREPWALSMWFWRRGMDGAFLEEE